MSDKRIKTAFEIAMEKVDAMGEITEEDQKRWKYTPEGEKLAARFLDPRDEVDLSKELEAYDEQSRAYASKAAQKVLTSAINLPKTESANWRNRQALEGLKLLKEDKVAADVVFGKICELLAREAEQGQQQREQAYNTLKAQFGEKIRQMGQQASGMQQEIEAQFRQEVQKTMTQVDLQYIQTLDGYKKELEAIK